MNTFIINYIIRSTLSLVLLYLFFILLLGNEKMHKFNRFYLLASLIFSFVVPLITIPVLIPSFQVTNSFDVSNNQNNYIQLLPVTLQQENHFNFERLIPFFYYSISIVLLIRFLFNLIRLQISKSTHPSIKYGGYKIVLINELVLPYSFLSTIYVNSKEYKKGRIPKELLSHEITHISQRHSIDIIFIELLKVFFWFNPLLLLFKKSIVLNHEYLADDAVTKSKNNFNSYIEILLNIAFRNNNSYLASSFNYSFTKKRLLMITKNKLSKTAILKKVAVIPLFIVLGLIVINAQDTKPVKTNAPPPPPPPFGYNTWWAPILAQHKVTPNPSKSWHSENIYEMGDQYSKENDIVTLKNAIILAKSYGNLYCIIRAESVIHNLKSNLYKCEDTKVEYYDQVSGSTNLVETKYYKDFNFRTSNDLIAPPPPPPPSSSKN